MSLRFGLMQLLRFSTPLVPAGADSSAWRALTDFTTTIYGLFLHSKHFKIRSYILFLQIYVISRSSIIIPLVNSGTSIWAGLVVFSVLGFAAERAGVPVGNVASAGPGLAFVTYPTAVSMMPAPNFWAITFFVMLFFLGVDTMVSLQSQINYFSDFFLHATLYLFFRYWFSEKENNTKFLLHI